MANSVTIRDRAATDLGLLRLGQALQAQDTTRIESGYRYVYAFLKAEGLAVWPYSGDVPDELVPYVVALVAEECVETYGVSDKRYNRIKAKASNAVDKIRELTTPAYVPDTEAEDF